MFRFWIILPLIILNFARAISVEDLPEKIRNSIFLLETRGGCASGFLLESGVIVTNAHVASGVCNTTICEEVYLSKTDKILGKTDLYKSIDFNVVAIFPMADLAILKPTGKVLFDKQNGLVAAYKGTPRDNVIDMYGDNGISGILSEVHVGNKIFSVGFPGCDQLTITEHTVNKVAKFEFIAHPEVFKGASGGPVFNEKFELVGIVSKKDLYGNSLFPNLRYLSSSLESLEQERIYFDILTHLDDFWSERTIEKFDIGDYFELKKLNEQITSSGYILNTTKACPELRNYFNYISLQQYTNVLPPEINFDSLNLLCGSVFRKSFRSFFAADYFSSVQLFSSHDKYRAIDYKVYLTVKEDLEKSSLNILKFSLIAVLVVFLEIGIAFLVVMKLGHFIFKKFPRLNKYFWIVVIVSEISVALGVYFKDKWLTAFGL